MIANVSASHRKLIQTTRPQFLSLFHSGSILIFIALLLSIFLASCSAAQPNDPTSIVQTAYDKLNNGDVDGFMELIAEDAVVFDSNGGRHVGSQAIREFLEKEVVPRHFRFELSDLSADGSVVTFTSKVYQGDQLLDTYPNSVDVVASGHIIFDGFKRDLEQECKSNPDQTFCPKP